MATEATLVNAQAIDAASLDSALESGARRDARWPHRSISRKVMTQIHVFSGLFWTAMFVLHTTQMQVVNERENWLTISWRAGISLCAFLLCLPIGAVIRRTLNRRVSVRVLAIGAACVPAAVTFAALGHLIWYKILKVDASPYPTAIAIAMQSHYYILLFVLWSVFCAAILYAAQLQERERKLLEAQALAHEAELKMLRYQINPHFLFNTLNAVSALIVTGQTAAAEAMVGKLARFFRNALSRESSAKVTLSEEIRVQLEYLTIELTRFPDRLSWSMHVEPGLDDALVPHLILQPLFENAIKHGVARSNAPVEIRFTATRGNGELLLTLANNVRPESQEAANPGEGVGLANVARRLASFYGEKGMLSASQRAERFVVELRLPLEITL